MATASAFFTLFSLFSLPPHPKIFSHLLLHTSHGLVLLLSQSMAPHLSLVKASIDQIETFLFEDETLEVTANCSREFSRRPERVVDLA
ncbi:unnamed protein product [Arabidopsis halleri]